MESITAKAEDPIAWAHWLQDRAFINIRDRFCTRCDRPLSLERCARCPDGTLLRCTHFRCHTSQSIRNGSFFERHRLPIHTVLSVLICFKDNSTQVACAELLGLDRGTVAQICDEIQARIEDNIRRHPVQFPSAGVYEAGEMVLQHVRSTDGSQLGTMNIGAIIHRKSDRVMLFVLPDGGAPTLLEAIERHVPAGSVVCTADWPPSRRMPPQYTHHNVNVTASEGEGAERTVHDATYGEVGVWLRYRHFLAVKQLLSLGRVEGGSRAFMYLHTDRDMFDLIRTKT